MEKNDNKTNVHTHVNGVDFGISVENAKKSTGIGLAIAKQLVELNGGSIYGKYEKGKLIIEVKLSEV